MPESEKTVHTSPASGDAQTVNPRPFQLVRVEKTRVPQGATGETWYRYVLENGRSTITGQRCGPLDEVTEYANHYAEQLNARNVAGHSAWSPRTKRRV